VPPTQAGRASGTRRVFRALIVDDHDENRDLYSSYLRQCGWKVEDVTDGPEALAVAAAFEPHVIVMDVRMPEMDGIEATRNLRCDERTSGIPVVVLTANALYEAAARAERCAAFVTKPCTPQELFAVLEEVIASADERWVKPSRRA
jgi:CheY-like chemotaxis protein